jgi:hypothetical protein
MNHKNSLIITTILQILTIVIMLSLTGFYKIIPVVLFFGVGIFHLLGLTSQKRWNFSILFSLFGFIITAIYMIMDLTFESSIRINLGIEIIGLLIVTLILIAINQEKKITYMKPPEIRKQRMEEIGRKMEEHTEKLGREISAIRENLMRIEVPDLQKPQKPREIYFSKVNNMTYHKPYCPRINRTKKNELITHATQDEAKSKGLKPCKICL